MNHEEEMKRAFFGRGAEYDVNPSLPKRKPQAERATPAQVDLHILRQQVLGKNAIPGSDKPSKWDLLATLAVVALIGFGSLKGWW